MSRVVMVAAVFLCVSCSTPEATTLAEPDNRGERELAVPASDSGCFTVGRDGSEVGGLTIPPQVVCPTAAK